MVWPRMNLAQWRPSTGLLLAAFDGSCAAPPTSSASDATLPAPPERMADGSDSTEARHGRISPCAATPSRATDVSARDGDKRSASPHPIGEREQPSPAAFASPPALTSAPWRTVRTSKEQRHWQWREATRRLGRGASHAALRVCMNAIRAEPPPGPPTRRARGCRGGVKQRSRAAPSSVHVSPVSKPSAPQRAPAIPEPQHAAGVPAGKVRAAVRRVRAVEKANRELTAARASDEAALLRRHELTTASASALDARLLALESALELATTEASAHKARLSALELANRALTKTFASGQAELLRLRELTTTTAFTQTRLVDLLHKVLDELWDDHDEIKTSAADQAVLLRELQASLRSEVASLQSELAWTDRLASVQLRPGRERS